MPAIEPCGVIARLLVDSGGQREGKGSASGNVHLLRWPKDRAR
jgi:hypothetical protein